MDNISEYWVGFDLGGTKMLSATFDDDFNLLSREKKRTKAIDGTKSVLDRIVENIEKSIEKADLSKSTLKGLGIGVPGTIDLESGVVIEAPNLGWENINLKKILEDRFECPVVLCNDVDAGMYGEYTAGAARGSYCSVGIFPGTGVGGGCVWDGKLIQGRRRTAMEVGHIQLYSGGQMDGAENIGTLETISSRLAIAAASAQAVFRGAAPHLKEEAGTDISNIRSGTLATAIKKGDQSIEKIVKNAVEYIGTMVVTLVHLFSPDRVVIGGGLAEAMPEIFVKETKRIADSKVLVSFRDTFDVVEAELGDDAAIIGAASWAKQSINS